VIAYGGPAVPAGNDPDGLWQVTFFLAALPPPALLEALEERSLSASIFGSELDDQDDPVRWRVDLLFKERPETAALEAELKGLLAGHGLAPDGALEVSWLPHQDWLAAVRMVRPPLQVGRFYVHGEGDPVPRRPRLVPLLIEAGLAFGSGEHQTTAACLEAFDALLRRRRFSRVLDMGCGSAILGIAACRVDRQARIVAVDNDPLAVRVAEDNARRNHVAARLRTLVADGYADPAIRRAGPYDLIFANILADPLIAMAGDLRRHLAPGGVAVLSGLLERQAGAVLAAHRTHGLREIARVERQPWVALVLRRLRPPPVSASRSRLNDGPLPA
jgi:ribosomal protein L11 methyltransferase